jgi:hypothetical protein
MHAVDCSRSNHLGRLPGIRLRQGYGGQGGGTNEIVYDQQGHIPKTHFTTTKRNLKFQRSTQITALVLAWAILAAGCFQFGFDAAGYRRTVLRSCPLEVTRTHLAAVTLPFSNRRPSASDARLSVVW